MRTHSSLATFDAAFTGPPPTVAWILVVLIGKVALQTVVVLLLTYVDLHPILVHSLWGEQPQPVCQNKTS